MTTTARAEMPASARRRTRAPARSRTVPLDALPAVGCVEPPQEQQGQRAVIAQPRPVLGDLYDHDGLNPFRAPSWRYQLAAAICDRTGAVSHESQDRHIAHMVDLLRLQRMHGPDAALPDALVPYGRALRLFVGPDEPERAILEAGLLARRTPETAGQALGLPSEVVHVYSAVFFDILGRMHRAGFIAGVVHNAGRPKKPTLGYVLRAFAFSGGPLVLDHLLHAFDCGRYALRPAYQSAEPEIDDLGLRAAIAMVLLPNKPAVDRFMLAMALRYDRLALLAHDKQRYELGERKLLASQLKGARRLFGVAVRDNPFLARLLAPAVGR